MHTMINTNVLLSQMKLKNVSAKDLADAQAWSITTAYRKINGKTAFTAPEVQTCTELLGLTTQVASEIFFASKLS